MDCELKSGEKIKSVTYKSWVIFLTNLFFGCLKPEFLKIFSLGHLSIRFQILFSFKMCPVLDFCRRNTNQTRFTQFIAIMFLSLVNFSAFDILGVKSP